MSVLHSVIIYSARKTLLPMPEAFIFNLITLLDALSAKRPEIWIRQEYRNAILDSRILVFVG